MEYFAGFECCENCGLKKEKWVYYAKEFPTDAIFSNELFRVSCLTLSRWRNKRVQPFSLWLVRRKITRAMCTRKSSAGCTKTILLRPPGSSRRVVLNKAACSVQKEEFYLEVPSNHYHCISREEMAPNEREEIE